MDSTADTITLRKADFYKEHDIDVHFGKKVTKHAIIIHNTTMIIMRSNYKTILFCYEFDQIYS